MKLNIKLIVASSILAVCQGMLYFFPILSSLIPEAIRRGPNGGQWRLSEKSLILSSVVWDFPDAELHLWAFGFAYELLTGKAKKALHQVWDEISKEYRSRI